MKKCDFFILRRNPDTHDCYAEKVSGYQQDFDVDGMVVSICFRYNDGYWTSTEKSTGLLISSWGETRKDAVKDVKEKLPAIKGQLEHGLNYGYKRIIERAYRDAE